MSTREELTLQAEKCLRLGRVDDAIVHYRELAHLEPVEWGVVKQLADLLERSGQREGAARQFARWADYLFSEGFHAKAAAIYKKVLKLDDADEHALWQLGEVSIALKLRADARVAFHRIVELRERRGDAAGAAVARDRRDAVEAAAAVPHTPMFRPPASVLPSPLPAVAPVVDEPAAPAVEPPVRPPLPVVELPDALALPNPVEAPIPPCTWVSAGDGGDVVEAPLIATEDTVPAHGVPGSEPPVEGSAPLVTDSGGGVSEGSAFDWAHLLGREVAEEVRPAAGPAVREVAVTVEPPAVVAPTHAPPVSELTAPEDTVPGDAVPESTVPKPTVPEPTVPEPQAVLASAPAEFVPPEDAGPRRDDVSASESAGPPKIGDLRAQPFFADQPPLQPSFSMPRAWLSEAPEPLPLDAPRRRAPEDDFFFMDDATPARWAPPPARALETDASVAGDIAQSGPGSEPAQVGADDVVAIDEEVDLTQLLEELKQWDPELPEPLRKPATEAPSVTSARAPQPDPSPDVDELLDAAFADLQRQGDARAVAEQQLAAGRVFLAAGLAAEAARAFERASGEPRSRFDAATALAELHRSRGQLPEAVSWYEQAATAPVPDAAVKRAVLYDLAGSLEAIGEADRAVGVLLDLLSHVEDYRDARARLDRLLRADAGG